MVISQTAISPLRRLGAWALGVMVAFLFSSNLSCAEPFVSPPVSEYSAYGWGFGKGGIFLHNVDGKSELWVTRASTKPGLLRSPVDSWMVLRWNGGSFVQIHVEPPYQDPEEWEDPEIVRMMPFLNDGSREVAVALSDRRIYFYDATNYQQKTIIEIPETPRAVLAADLDRDGTDELVFLTWDSDPRLIIADQSGKTKWAMTLPLSVYYFDDGGLAAAQIDADPALEIVVSGDSETCIIDSRKQNIEWRGPSFGSQIEIANVDTDSEPEIIGGKRKGSNGTITVFDGDAHIPVSLFETVVPFAFSLAQTGPNRSQLLLMNSTELLLYDLEKRRKTWTLPNPHKDYSVNRVLAGDVDNDGSPDILWGGVSANRESNYVCKASLETGAVWGSHPVTGALVSPAVGDIDGDDIPDLVVAASRCRSTHGYDELESVLVFDPLTRELKGDLQLPSGGAIVDLQLKNLRGDKTREIIVARNDPKSREQGRVDAYSFRSGNFDRFWFLEFDNNHGGFSGMEMDDLDGDGTPEFILQTSGKLAIWDYNRKTELWKVPLSSDWSRNEIRPPYQTRILVGNFDDDPAREIACEDEIYWYNDAHPKGAFGICIVDSRQQKVQETIYPYPFDIITSLAPGPRGTFYAGTDKGLVCRYQHTESGFREESLRFSSNPITALHAISDESLLVRTKGDIAHWYPALQFVDWIGMTREKEAWDELALLLSETGMSIFTAGRSILSEFHFESQPPPPVLRLKTDRTQATEDASVILTVTRAGSSDLDVTATLEFKGTAERGIDYTCGEKIHFLPGETLKRVPIHLTLDQTVEETESVEITLSGESYAAIPDPTTSFRIRDRKPALRIEAIDPIAVRSDGQVAKLKIVASYASKVPISISLHMGGTAVAGEDYFLPVHVQIPAGSKEEIVTIRPVVRPDKRGTRTVFATIRPGLSYYLSKNRSAATKIVDE